MSVHALHARTCVHIVSTSVHVFSMPVHACPRLELFLYCQMYQLHIIITRYVQHCMPKTWEMAVGHNVSSTILLRCVCVLLFLKMCFSRIVCPALLCVPCSFLCSLLLVSARPLHCLGGLATHHSCGSMPGRMRPKGRCRCRVRRLPRSEPEKGR